MNDGIGEGAKFVSRNGNTIELLNVGTGNGLDVTESGGGIAVRAINQATSGSAYGVFAVSESVSGIGAYA